MVRNESRSSSGNGSQLGLCELLDLQDPFAILFPELAQWKNREDVYSRIRDCWFRKDPCLDFTGCSLSEFPPELQKFCWVNTINLNGAYFRKIFYRLPQLPPRVAPNELRIAPERTMFRHLAHPLQDPSLITWEIR